MPELPEVETIRRGLAQYAVGHRIEDVEIRLPKMVQGKTSAIIGAIIAGVRRFGKGLVIDLNNGYSIAVHVKMTGQLLYQGPDIPKGSTPSSAKVGPPLPNSWTHVILKLDKGSVLYYNDLRQFGWIKIVKTKEVGELPFFKELGPEPFAGLTFEVFKKIVMGAKTSIKLLLMDQKKIGGIGNIYANDALFRAKISPGRQASSLTEAETHSLFVSIETVMKKGIEVGGASEWQYVNVLGQHGNYQNFFLVYGKKKCSNCKGLITKVQLGGRGTYFCERCQN